jgi:hypothetical protein
MDPVESFERDSPHSYLGRAELLIPLIRAQRQPKVHLITYAASVTKNMVHFNKLSYYVLPRLPVGYKPPSWFSIELGIFAGRLYIDFQSMLSDEILAAWKRCRGSAE